VFVASENDNDQALCPVVVNALVCGRMLGGSCESELATREVPVVAISSLITFAAAGTSPWSIVLRTGSLRPRTEVFTASALRPAAPLELLRSTRSTALQRPAPELAALRPAAPLELLRSTRASAILWSAAELAALWALLTVARPITTGAAIAAPPAALLVHALPHMLADALPGELAPLRRHVAQPLADAFADFGREWRVGATALSAPFAAAIIAATRAGAAAIIKLSRAVAPPARHRSPLTALVATAATAIFAPRLIARS